MNIREIINLVGQNKAEAYDQMDDSMDDFIPVVEDLLVKPTLPTGRQAEILSIIGCELKELLIRINLRVIADEDLAGHVVNVIEDVHRRKSVPRPAFIASLYGQDNREEELSLAKREAEIRRINAETAKINAERSPQQ